MCASMNRSSEPDRNESGQASVEYAVVLVGMLALIIAFGVLHAFLENGQIIEHALANSSHAIESCEFVKIKDFVFV